MKKEDHPRGLSLKEREEWHLLCNRLFELYDKMPMGKTKTKIVAGSDEHNKGNILMFFKGTKEELLGVKEYLE